MTFEEILDQAVAMLQRRGRIAYSALKRQFDLDDDYLDDLKDAILYAHPQVVDDGRGLDWTAEAAATPVSTSRPVQASEPPLTQQDQPPQAEPPPFEPHTPDAERRHLTVMFADVVDSTQLSGQLDPEDYRDVLRAYQATCAEVIHRFDGYIAQHLGDALLVYFGYPQAHEDEAQRAILTGLGIIQAMHTLNTRLQQEKGIRLAIRVGVHTGLTVVGDIGEGQKHELLALGEAPNIASRIQGLAAPDAVVISATTYRLVQGYFTVADLGRHTLKGVAEPQQIYRILQKSGAQSRLDITLTGGLTPLVGRESEVTLLVQRWAVVQAGQGQVVVLSGEGGIGKSRLVHVLKQHVAGDAHTRLECRGSPYYQNTALYPITDLLQRTLQWQPGDTSAHRLETLEHALSQYRIPLEECVPLFAPLVSLSIPEDRYPPLPWTPQRQRQKTLESIVAMLLELAERQPLLFIVEDLHWTDPTTLELLGLLIDQVPTAALCIVLTCRPTFQPSWTPRSYVTQVTLNRLAQPQIAGMAAGVAGGKRLPADVLQQIIDKTDGVPLFVEEITKAVLESGALQEVNGQYERVGSLAALAIPATLQDSLMARLDRLTTAKAVAQYASVIGRQCSYELLHALAQLDAATLQQELGRLVEAELLYQRGVPPQALYTFKHALIQDAAYESLLKSTRQQYHGQIAQVLTERFPETTATQPELLAHHYSEAGDLEQAVGYWLQAGRQVFQRSANIEAVAHLSRGLALLDKLPPTPERDQRELEFQTVLGPALMALKGQGSAEVGQAYARARELCQRVGETPQLLPILFGLWRFYLMQAEHRTARQVAEQCFSLAQRLHDPALLLPARFALGASLHFGGGGGDDLVSAQAHFDQAIALYDAQAHRELAFRFGIDLGVWHLAYVAWNLWLLGYPEQALRRSYEAVTLAQELKHAFSLAAARAYVTVIHMFRRELPATQQCAEVTVAFARQQDFPQWSALNLIYRGWALTLQGQTEEGLAQLRQALEAWRALGHELGRNQYLFLLADAYRQAGQPERGFTAVAEGLEFAQRTGEHRWEPELYRLQGELLQLLPADHDVKAEACFHRALEVARHQQAKAWELRAATSLARLWQQQGKRQEAYDLLAPVYGWFTEGFDTADLQEARGLLDQLQP